MNARTSTHLSMHLGPDARVECSTYPDSGPILTVDGAGTYLNLTSKRIKGVESFDVDNARALLAAATVYLAECERLYAQTSTRTDGEDAPGTERAA